MGLYDEALEKVKPYMGEASQNFLNRQVVYHLKIRPESLGKEHITDLAKWVGISASIFIDREKADSLKEEILRLG